MARPSVYSYLDYRSFLRDWFESKKAEDPKFSQRAFVRLAGKRSPGLLSEVIERRRNLSTEMTRAFTHALGLNASERAFFTALVRLDQASGSHDRNQAWAAVSASRNFQQAQRIEGESFRYLSHWYYPAIRELAARPDFCADPAWIANTLCPAITPAKAKRALQTLMELKLLIEDDHGNLRPADGTLTTPHEVAGLAVHNYHYGMLERASEAIERFEPDKRHFLGATISVPSHLMPVLKRELDTLQERILDLAEPSGDLPSDVLQVNLHIFPLAHRRMEDTE